jgi:hypothetical protein
LSLLRRRQQLTAPPFPSIAIGRTVHGGERDQFAT